ncbi:MAG: adenylyl-sulfate kinase [Calditrichaeota bacterium]|nr:MAG: adenylyl-sulfate kinase [Calditrichota bacterium]
MKPLAGLRILVCGKGGSGKSSVVTLMSHVLHDQGYNVLLLDGDASNPGGLARLVFGLKKGPKPLIDFFGGRERVECPVDDPSPLTRKGDSIPVTEKPIDLAELPPSYYVQKNNITLFQVGKIQNSYEGCDGPMSKITRDYIVKGEHVMLIDVEAGIEHFGRGVEKNIDIVLVVVDPTYESFTIAERVTKICNLMGIERVWVIINAVQSEFMKSTMIKELRKKKTEIFGSITYDHEIAKAGLMGDAIDGSKAKNDIVKIAKKLEDFMLILPQNRSNKKKGKILDELKSVADTTYKKMTSIINRI